MWDLQKFVMLLGGIYTAGRFDGYHDLDMRDFHQYSSGLFNVSEHKINSLEKRYIYHTVLATWRAIVIWMASVVTKSSKDTS
jgi:hypothetical protein